MKLDTIIAKRPSKTIYRDGGTVIKQFDESYAASDVLNEARNLAIVREAGVRAPAVLDVRLLDGKWAIVTEYVAGKTLAELYQDDPPGEDEYFARFVDVQVGLHACKASKLWHHTDKMHDKISSCGLDTAARFELHTRLDGLPRHNKLCHGDFTPGNVIITPGDEAYVIDWAHATQGNASSDAARTYLRFMLAGRAAWAEKYMDMFCAKTGTSRQYVQKWLPIVAASQLVKGNPAERDLLTRWANVVEYE